MKRTLTTMVAALVLGLAGSAGAHEGHDHGAPIPPPSATTEERTAEAASRDLELLVRWPATEAGQAVPMRLFVADWATNRPIAGLDLDLSFAGPGSVEAHAEATGAAGIYEASVAFPTPGRYALTVTAVGGGQAEVLAVPGVEVGPSAAVATGHDDHDQDHDHGDHAHGWLNVWTASGALALLLLLWVAYVAGRRAVKIAALAGAVVAPVLAMGGWRAMAHGGDDHAHEAPVVSAPLARSGGGSGQVVRKETQFLLEVETALAAPAALVERLEVTGEVVTPPDRKAGVLAPQGGQLRTAGEGGRLPTVGERVERGQVLGVVEAVLGATERASFASERGRAAAEAQAASARAAAAKKQLERLRGLEGIVARRDVEAAEAELAGAQAEVKAARAAGAAFSEAGATARLEVRAPIAGVVTAVGASAGEVVEPGQALWTVVDPSVVWARARVFEADVGRALASEAAQVTVQAWPGERFAGRRVAVGEAVDPATRTLEVLFEVREGAERLKAGMFAGVALTAGAPRETLAVPEAAVLEVEGRRLVFVHTAPERFEAREVALGRRDGGRVEVTGGLAPGERVTVRGLGAVRHAPRAGR